MTSLRTAAALLVSAVALPLAPRAQTPTIGTVVDESGVENTEPCELYALKAGGGSNADWLAHLAAKGGGYVGMQDGDFDGAVYQVLAGNFSVPESPTDVVAAFVTCPDGRLHFDSGDLSTGFNFMGAAALQTVGNSVSGTLTLPGSGAAYPVDFGAGSVDCPIIGADPGQTTGDGLNFPFAPIAELNDEDQGGFSWGGSAADPGSTIPDGGFIVGYNVYRRLADGAGPPDAATLGAMENWISFATMNFDQTAGDPGGWRDPAPADVIDRDDATCCDFVGMQNPDARPYTGDEILLFVDAVVPVEHDRDRDGWPEVGGQLNPFPPDLTQPYWYAVQPVVRGSVADFASVSLAGAPAADHAEDLDGDGVDDWVDLDLDGSPDFYSPNENHGVPGLGLTHGGAPLLSPVVLSDPSRLPAEGEIVLVVEPGPGGLRLLLSTGLERGTVLGYHLWRLAGASRERVNESLVPARGGHANSYRLLDERFAGRRARDLAYEVEVVFNDGTPSERHGPFAAAGATRGSARRAR